jgi:hypothetical protein
VCIGVLVRQAVLKYWWCRSTKADLGKSVRAVVNGFAIARFVLLTEGWATEGGACGSAVDEELDGVDVGGVVGGEEENCFC